MTPAGARWELDALSRLDRARGIITLILEGHLQANVELVDSLSQLVQSGATSLRARDRCEEKAA